jgi:hypothetical protein
LTVDQTGGLGTLFDDNDDNDDVAAATFNGVTTFD